MSSLDYRFIPSSLGGIYYVKWNAATQIWSQSHTYATGKAVFVETVTGPSSAVIDALLSLDFWEARLGADGIGGVEGVGVGED
jgi:hypothetical protein